MLWLVSAIIARPPNLPKHLQDIDYSGQYLLSVLDCQHQEKVRNYIVRTAGLKPKHNLLR